MLQFAAVFLGGGAGAVLRWLLSLKYNAAWPGFPTGTLLANLSGGLLAGFFVAFLTFRPNWNHEFRLFIVVGLLGGLTTFSTFSAEVAQLMERGRIGLSLAVIGANLCGSLGLAALGLWLGKLILAKI
jgi:CrcB protein